ncbi:flavin reductase [Pseudooceanicola sp. CBS1P-1]|uniref:FMN reductase n=1 Tax=Pseudooceanicola albus TaxID=2692189 RepID=A0A6L7G8C3_9RHOB|nr:MULTISPECIES: flavin reductase [Pseudooceanicola]MBT9385989.1 flavin reductase [Pseudooceanicola endophyticus]MXN19590.1 FMN reductase [Pseudooceanicola albus]
MKLDELPETPPQALSRVSLDQFREGMSRLAGAVNIVTTDGPAGRAGFTASAVCSVTAEPPTLLVCVNRSGSVAETFAGNDALCVNTVGPEHQELAMLFGGKTPMEERFARADWHAAATGAPALDGAVVSFDCEVTQRLDVGTHTVLFAEIVGVVTTPGASASAYWGRKFHELKG